MTDDGVNFAELARRGQPYDRVETKQIGVHAARVYAHPLDRLKLTERQQTAGWRLYTDHRQASSLPAPSLDGANIAQNTQGGSVSVVRIDAARRYRDAMKALGRANFAVLDLIVVQELTLASAAAHFRVQKPETVKRRLARALNALADWYGV